jgi:DNA-binding MarR family transcriptional regulator
MDTDERFLSEPGPMGLFTRLTRVGLLLDEFQHRALDPFCLRFIDFSVLRVLQLAGSPYRVSAGELSEIVLRSTGGMTQILDRLSQLGLVRRVADANDRRKVLAELTDDGLDVAQRASASYARERRRILRSLSGPEVDTIDASIRLLLDVFRDAGVATRPERLTGR